MDLAKFNLFNRGAGPGEHAQPASAAAPTGEAAAWALAVRRKLRLWGGLWAVFGVLAFIPLVWYILDQEAVKGQIKAAVELQLAAGRLQQLAPLAASGNTAAFPGLKQVEQTFSLNADGLLQGSAELDRVHAALLPVVSEMNEQWQATKKNLDALLGLEKALTDLGKSAKTIKDKEAEMLELSEQILGALAQGGAPGRDLYAAGQLVAFATRIPRGARDVLSRSPPGAGAKDLEAGAKAYPEALRALSANNAVRDRVDKLAGIYAAIGPDIDKMTSGLKTAAAAGQAVAQIDTHDKALIESTQKVAEAITTQTRGGGWAILLTAILAALAGYFAIMFTRVLVSDARHRQQQSEIENRRNQGAILRLLDEMGTLAEGDLTVAASVTEDMTGAIADSINFTVGELRTIVHRINQTMERVAEASSEAQSVSNDLLAAAEKQSEEIKESTDAVLRMAQSVGQVSDSAAESAKVAEQSLAAAEKGAAAVQNAISGMNEIRGQIQETSKRIKRLGESSQEISEIVELISDITEQTNVLALNAAIQAASAGDAGRGFSVVAEEVQRLAERSAQATKQISGIVKTIQADTQDAVTAMERSTLGVVEGARLSDAAGQALVEIGKVSRDLARLIESISGATRLQADSAARVAANMRDILAITQQTTEGTKLTSRSISDLAGLASELRSSVANFKV
jgi:twitching motility protein PilJ